MDINLEKIELVKDRTGCTYAEAKEALEQADGSVVDAIIDIEEKLNKEFDSVGGGSLKDSPIFAKMKDIVDKGNVTKILIRKNGKTIVNFPLTAGVIGAVLVPWGAILGIVAALGTQCDIEFIDDKGEVIDINGKVVGMYDKAKDAAQSVIGKAGKEGGTIDETLDKVEDTAEDVKEAFVKGTARIMEMLDKLEKSGKIGEVKESLEKVAKKAGETARNIAREASEMASKAEEDFKADAEAAADEEFKDEEI